MNKLIKDALILTLITLIAGVALGAVYEITKEPIAKAEEDTRQSAYRALFEDAASFAEEDGFDREAVTKAVTTALLKKALNNFAEGDLQLDSCIIASDSSDKDMGMIITVTSHKGYNGDITLSVGIGKDGTLKGYQITSIGDTPGLGMKATEEKFSSQFKGVDSEGKTVTKTTPGEDEIEAISGATITSRAVTNAVNAAIEYFNLNNGGGQADE